MYQDYYNFATITNYPELESYLKEKLSELGKTKFHRFLSDASWTVEIELYNQPVIYDWHKVHPSNVLYINSDAGGCFMRNIRVNCRVLPKQNSRRVTFDFDLILDSRDLPEDKHDPRLIMNAIDKFVFLASNGFCYHFKNR